MPVTQDVRDDPAKLGRVVAVTGPTGPSGNQLSVVAGEALGGHRAITATGFHATEALLDLLAGISSGAAEIGQTATLVSRGPLTDPSWSWTPDAPIFVGPNGVLTQTAPTNSARRVAWAATPTLINVDIFPIIQLA